MYLFLSPSSGTFFVWTGPETTPALEHGIYLQGEMNTQMGNLLRSSQALGTSQSYFCALPRPLISLTLYGLRWLQRATAMVSGRVGALVLFCGCVLGSLLLVGSQEIAEKTTFAVDQEKTKESKLQGDTPRVSHSLSQDWDSLASDILKDLRAAGEPFPFKPGFVGVFAHRLLRPHASLRGNFGLIPLQDALAQNVTVSLELPFRRLLIHNASGKWEIRNPTQICGNDGLYLAEPLDRLALAFDEDRMGPGDAPTVAQLPQNHASPASCHEELTEWH